MFSSVTRIDVIGRSARSDAAYIFADSLQHPIYAQRKAYYEQKFMAGRFHPNPYHPPADRERVKTGIGHRWHKVKEEAVPRAFSTFPQYASGRWSVLR